MEAYERMTTQTALIILNAMIVRPRTDVVEGQY